MTAPGEAGGQGQNIGSAAGSVNGRVVGDENAHGDMRYRCCGRVADSSEAVLKNAIPVSPSLSAVSVNGSSRSISMLAL
ncbi:hypothetical protein GCM10010172_34530 [Paractinoplanes ferrugineus]|uniref:Uncharacterized protein n=1 Tax=Paractinoplanes ferrugineus TaxID=113564 RepID=A0A919JA44_9ACTN|nr:hypothetical protein Afe05nite_73140 [Actinoplanes ferrugineus]